MCFPLLPTFPGGLAATRSTHRCLPYNQCYHPEQPRALQRHSWPGTAHAPVVAATRLLHARCGGATPPLRGSSVRAAANLRAAATIRAAAITKLEAAAGLAQPAGASTSASSVDEPDPSSSSALITFAEVQEVAARRGMSLTLTTLGPLYRIVCRKLPGSFPTAAGASSAEGHAQSEGDEQGPWGTAARGNGAESLDGEWRGGGKKGRVLAVTTGFIAPPPFRLMHCDTLQVFTRHLRGDEGARLRFSSTLGLGLLLGGATFAYGHESGCKKAEILAINDDEHTHARLVKYYSYFGFVPVQRVGGNGLSDLPHMLVWGGEGTRMDADVERMLARWTRALRRTLRRDAADAAAAAAARATAAASATAAAAAVAENGGGPGGSGARTEEGQVLEKEQQEAVVVGSRG